MVKFTIFSNLILESVKYWDGYLNQQRCRCFYLRHLHSILLLKKIFYSRFQVFELSVNYQCPHKYEQFWVRNLLSAGKSIYLIYTVILDWKLKQLKSFLLLSPRHMQTPFVLKSPSTRSDGNIN